MTVPLLKVPKDFRPGLILALVSIPIFIGALDLTVISAVLPQVILDLEIPLKSGLDTAAWLVTGYLLAYSVSMTFTLPSVEPSSIIMTSSGCADCFKIASTATGRQCPWL